MQLISQSKAKNDLKYVRRKSCEAQMGGGRVQKHSLNSRCIRLRELIYSFLVREIVSYMKNKTAVELIRCHESGLDIHS